MKRSKNVMQEIISVYESKGYVTRKDVAEMDNRPFCKGLAFEMNELGYTSAICIEVNAGPGNYYDYSNVLFDSDIFDFETITKIMRTEVLHSI